jgi:hypothetical protein
MDEDEYEDEGGSCRTVSSRRSNTKAEAQRAKAAHLTPVICLLYSETACEIL